MLRFWTLASFAGRLLRPLGYVLRDLAPWLIRAATAWLLSRLNRRRRLRPVPCRGCPLWSPAQEPAQEAPASSATPSPTAVPPPGAGSATLLLWPLVAGTLMLSSAGCTPAAPYLAADRATFDAVAPEYAAYVDADPALSVERKSRRHRTLEAWRLRLHKAESASAR